MAPLEFRIQFDRSFFNLKKNNMNYQSYGDLPPNLKKVYDEIEAYFSDNFHFEYIKKEGLRMGKEGGLSDELVKQAWNQTFLVEKNIDHVQILHFPATEDKPPIIRFLFEGETQTFDDFEISQPLFEAFDKLKGCDFWMK
jgi:hypothetical protein